MRSDVVTWPLIAATAFAVLDWISAWRGWKKLLFVAKPATLVFLILWSLLSTDWRGEMLWFAIGLVFSLIGDVFLMLDLRFFLPGLAAFLLTHIFYLVGFNQTPAALSLPSLIFAVLIGILAARILRMLRPGILKASKGRSLLIATTVYALVLSLMVLSALLTFYRPGWTTLAASLASIGALLFLVSDTTLTYDRFVRSFDHAQTAVHVTYHLGQFLIIFGVMLHFLA